jgi:hypothetical protein
MNVLTPRDFESWPQLERKLYKYIIFDNDKYIYSNNVDTSQVSMLILFNANKTMNLYYCVNNIGAFCLVPQEKDETSEINDYYFDSPEQTYKVEMLKNISIDFFMEQLGSRDTVRTTHHAINPDELGDKDIKSILEKYAE